MITCPKCDNTNFYIDKDLIDNVQYNIVRCQHDDYIMGVFPDININKLKQLQEQVEELESRISDLE